MGNEKSELQEILIDGSLDRLLYSKFPITNSNEYLQDCNFCSYKDQLGDKTRSEKVKNSIRTKLLHNNDQIFESFVSTLNVHFINELMRKKSIPHHLNVSLPFLEKLLFHMCEIYNYGLVDKRFALPTSAMSFISQLAINIETTRRLTRGFETELRDGDNWGDT